MTSLWARLIAAMRHAPAGKTTVATTLEQPIWNGPLRAASFPLLLNTEDEDPFAPFFRPMDDNAGVCVRGIPAVQLYARWSFLFQPNPEEEDEPTLFVFGRIAGQWAVLTKVIVDLHSLRSRPLLFPLELPGMTDDSGQADLSKVVLIPTYERIAVGIYPPHWAQSGALEAFVAPHNEEGP